MTGRAPSRARDVAQFVKEWWGQLGIGVDGGVTEDDTLLVDLTPPETTHRARPTSTRTCGAGSATSIRPRSSAVHDRRDAGGSSDTFWSNARFDELFTQQGKTIDETERKAMLQEMQEIFYTEVPNIPLYFDSELHAYRTDQFGGWQNQPPDNGTPLFGSGRSATRC